MAAGISPSVAAAAHLAGMKAACATAGYEWDEARGLCVYSAKQCVAESFFPYSAKSPLKRLVKANPARPASCAGCLAPTGKPLLGVSMTDCAKTPGASWRPSGMPCTVTYKEWDPTTKRCGYALPNFRQFCTLPNSRVNSSGKPIKGLFSKAPFGSTDPTGVMTPSRFLDVVESEDPIPPFTYDGHGGCTVNEAYCHRMGIGWTGSDCHEGWLQSLIEKGFGATEVRAVTRAVDAAVDAADTLMNKWGTSALLHSGKLGDELLGGLEAIGAGILGGLAGLENLYGLIEADLIAALSDVPHLLGEIVGAIFHFLSLKPSVQTVDVAMRHIALVQTNTSDWVQNQLDDMQSLISQLEKEAGAPKALQSALSDTASAVASRYGVSGGGVSGGAALSDVKAVKKLDEDWYAPGVSLYAYRDRASGLPSVGYLDHELYARAPGLMRFDRSTGKASLVDIAGKRGRLAQRLRATQASGAAVGRVVFDTLEKIALTSDGSAVQRVLRLIPIVH